MTEKGPAVSAKQLAMSRALGAAFLSHQVEQLEKSVNARGGNDGGGGPATASSNWRERRYQQANGASAGAGGRGGLNKAQISGNKQATSAARSVSTTTGATKTATPPLQGGVGTASKGRDSPIFRRRSCDEERERSGDNTKDADIVVVDASVLVHALYQVKRWCKDGREEIIIIPLEALNTLDLLKKGITSLAQRARAASRILEAQVGTNPRIQVQRDDAFVYWDKINFVPTPDQEQTTVPTNGDNQHNDTTTIKPSTTSPNASSFPPSPEWVRRTICCAKWEVENSLMALSDGHPRNHTDAAINTTSGNGVPQRRVVLAVLSPNTSSSPASSSPQSGPLKLSANGIGGSSEPVSTTPVVPLPAPHSHTRDPHHNNIYHHHGNKFEPRSSGTLVSLWAAKAGIEVIEVDAAAPGHGRGGGGGGREREEDEEVPRGTGAGTGRKGPHYADGRGHGHGHGHGHGRRRSSVNVSEGGPSGQGQEFSSSSAVAGSTGLVERPPAVMAMMEMVSQSSKGRVVRVLARGEKLDP